MDNTLLVSSHAGACRCIIDGLINACRRNVALSKIFNFTHLPFMIGSGRISLVEFWSLFLVETDNQK